MFTQNPFASVGTVIKGSRFIGRHEEIRTIRSRLFSRDDFGSIAIVGIPRIGKSSLVHRALMHDSNDELRALRAVVAYMDVSTIATSESFFDGLVRRIIGSLEDRALVSAELHAQAQRAVETKTEGQRFFEVEKLFRTLQKERIRAICVLDEFDSVRSIFKNKIQCFKFLRELASGGDCKAGFVLISKRPLSTVSALSGIDPTYWRNVLREEYLRGFDASAMNLYFESLQKAGIKCPIGLRQQVVSLCGAHPFLLDSFAFEAYELSVSNKSLGSKTCASLLAKPIADVCTLVAEIIRDSPWLDKLAQVFSSSTPNVSSEDIGALLKYGILIRDSDGGLNAFVPAFRKVFWEAVKPAVSTSLELSIKGQTRNGPLAPRSERLELQRAELPNSDSLKRVRSGLRSTKQQISTESNKSLRRWAGESLVTAAVIFTDIIDSTKTSESIGDTAWSAIRRAHFRQGKMLLKKNRGYLIKTLGDSLMIVFRSAAAALDFAVEFRVNTGHRDLRVRQAANIGPVTIDSGDIFGRHVNFAARIAQEAGESEIVVSEAFKQDLDSIRRPEHSKLFWRKISRVRLKGFSEACDLWKLAHVGGHSASDA